MKPPRAQGLTLIKLKKNYVTIRFNNGIYNRASKFVESNSITRACFIFLLCTLMTSANKSLEKKIFLWVENVIKQLVLTSAVRSSRYEALGKFGERSRSLEQLDERTLTSEPIVKSQLT